MDPFFCWQLPPSAHHSQQSNARGPSASPVQPLSPTSTQAAGPVGAQLLGNGLQAELVIDLKFMGRKNPPSL